MAQAETSQVKLRMSIEGTWGEAPSTPDMHETRWTGGSLAHVKDTVESATIRSDRNIDFLAEVAARAEGDINCEIAQGLRTTASGSWSQFDPVELGMLTELAMQSNVSTVDDTSANWACTVTTDVLTHSTALPAAMVNGMVIRTENFANSENNGVWRINSVTATTCVCTKLDGSAAGFVTEAAGATVTVRANMWRNGSTKKSALIELEFPDLTNAFVYFTGMRAGRMAGTVTAGQIATITFGMMGRAGFTAAATQAGSTTTSDVTPVMNATSNVGFLVENDAALATAIRSITFELNNNPRAVMAVGDKYAKGINLGFARVTGRIEAYFEDTNLLDRFINHTETDLSFVMAEAEDSSGDPEPTARQIIYTMPEIYYSGGSPQVPGVNDEVTQALDFTGADANKRGYTIQVDMIPADGA